MKKILLLSILLLCFSCSKDENSIDDKQEKTPAIFMLSTSVSPSEGGSITGGEEVYNDREEVTLTATPSEDFEFKEWQGGITGSENPVSIVMTSDMEVVAIFEKKVYSLDFDILGKWYFQSPSTSSNSQKKKNFSKQSENNSCSIISIEFRDDGTFTTVTDQGEFEGQYEITSNNSIDLGNGKMENLSFVNELLSFTITLDSGCSVNSNAQLLTYVPDDVFESELIKLGYDDVLDNFVSTKNIETIKDLNLSPSESIGDLTGMESFKELEELKLYNGYDYSNYKPGSGFLDITKNLELRILDLASYALRSLDVSKNLKLEKIFLDTNGLESSIDFSNNTHLREVFILYQYNKVPMDFSFQNSPNLEKIGFEDAAIGSVDLTRNHDLTSIYFTEAVEEVKFSGVYEHLKHLEITGSGPYRKYIDFANFPNLENLHIAFYPETIDLSGNPKLQSLSLTGDYLTSLDLSFNPLLKFFSIYTHDASKFDCIKVNAEQLSKLETGGLMWSSEWDYSLDCASKSNVNTHKIELKITGNTNSCGVQAEYFYYTIHYKFDDDDVIFEGAEGNQERSFNHAKLGKIENNLEVIIHLGDFDLNNPSEKFLGSYLYNMSVVITNLETNKEVLSTSLENLFICTDVAYKNIINFTPVNNSYTIERLSYGF